MSKVIEITDRTFEEEVLRSDIPTEVDFWAPWCGPCRMVSPIYDKLSMEYDGRFKFCKINVDENAQTAMKYQIMSIPMQMYFADGQKVDEILGAVPEHTIRTMVEGILKSHPTDERGRLRAILSSWIEHNNQDTDRFSKWVEKARGSKDFANYGSVIEAAQQVEEATQRLSQALTEL